MSIARLKVLGSTHKNSRLIFMCASGDTVYASEVLAKQILMQDEEWSARATGVYLRK